MNRLEIKARAKINLFLEVLAERKDGYHEIRGILQPISLFDTLTIEKHRAGIETRIKMNGRLNALAGGATRIRPEENLTNRAALMLKAAAGYKGGARLYLKKRVPIAAGLGGGSADAAATLKGLNTIWQTGLSPTELMELGARIGSDVPALTRGGTVCMRGRGEVVVPLPRKRRHQLWLLLVYPGFGVSTGDIYRRYARHLTCAPREAKFHSVVSGLAGGSLKKIAGGMFNALQAIVFRKYPLLEMIKNKLEEFGAEGVTLSGSGSTVFALARDRKQALRLGQRICAGMGCPLWTCVARAVDE